MEDNDGMEEHDVKLSILDASKSREVSQESRVLTDTVEFSLCVGSLKLDVSYPRVRLRIEVRVLPSLILLRFEVKGKCLAMRGDNHPFMNEFLKLDVNS